nr:MAG TPA: hypothetical protein [Microviridae sp.]
MILLINYLTCRKDKHSRKQKEQPTICYKTYFGILYL